MSLNIEELKRKIIYRSKYRGSKEMCIILNSFVNSIINKLNKNDLHNLLDLLGLDDDSLVKYQQEKKIDPRIKENNITKLFKDYNSIK